MNARTVLAAVLAMVMAASCGGRPTESPTDSRPQGGDGKAPETQARGGSHSGNPSDAGIEGRVDLAPDVQQRLGIGIETVTERPLAVVLRLTGSIQPIDSRVSHVRPLARGRVQQVLVRVGDRVARGQPLVVFDNIEAGELAAQHAAASADLARLRVQLATATRQTERSRKLADIGAMPQKEYDANLGEQQQLEASVRAQESTVAGMEARLRRYGLADGSPASVTSIRAPFAGVVTQLTAAPGEVADASSDLFTIADISRVYAQGQVFEKDLGQLRVGQEATVRVEAYPDERFAGRVSVIGAAVDPQSRTVPVRCEVDNTRGLLKLDMFATIELPTASSAPALAVPSEAIQTLKGKRVVFVSAGPAQFVARAVETGRVAGPMTEITGGLTRGDRVVIRGAFKMKSAVLSKDLGEKEGK